MDYKALIPVDTMYFLNGFTKEYYPRRFADYCCGAEKAFLSLTGSPREEAKAMVAWMDSQVKGLFKKRRRLEQELILLQYTVPAAIRCDRKDFAEALNTVWNEVHPDFRFGMASYEEFYENFNTTLLGFKIDKGDTGR